MPKVTIGLPVYNGEKYLEESLNSILSQTYKDMEIIISDNASTDRTGDICKAYAMKDPRIRYYRNETNLGACRNYNRLFQLATGEFFKWASHDDVCAPLYIERCVGILEKYPSVILAYPKTLIIDANSLPIKSYRDELHVPYENPVYRFKRCIFRPAGECNAVFGLIRSSFLEKTNLIGNYNGADYILLAQLAILGQIYEIPEELFLRRDHPETSVRANPKASDVAGWYDPARTNMKVQPECRRFYEYMRSILTLEGLSPMNRIGCALHMMKWFWWNKSKIMNEIGINS